MSASKDTFLTWFSHNLKANKQFIEKFKRAENLPEESVGIFSHILNSHIIWLNRIHELEEIAIPNPWNKHPISEFSSINKKCYELTEWFLQAERYGMSLKNIITYKNTKEQEYRNSIAEIYFHILTHSAYHRGQLAKLFQKANIDPPVTDFIFCMRNLRLEGKTT